MKKFRKLTAMVSALVLAGCMVGSFSVLTTSATAAETYSITVKATDEAATDVTSNYSAYQVFKGDVASDGTVTVTGWGSGVTPATVVGGLVDAASKFTNTTLKTDFAKLSKDAYTDAIAATIAQTISSAELTDDSDDAQLLAAIFEAAKDNAADDMTKLTSAGYYLLLDNTSIGTDTDAALSRRILTVTGAEEVNAKVTKPTVVKKVKEDSSTEDGGYGEGYNDVADYSIGEEVPFLLQATISDASEVAQYSAYKLVFHDTLDSQFTAPKAADIKVYLVDPNDTSYASMHEITVDSSNVSVDVTGQNITVTIADLVNALPENSSLADGSSIRVEYSAVLSSSANIGNAGQENKVYLEYSNNPNVTTEGEYPTTSTGKTPDDKVVVYTYALKLIKKDGNTDAFLKDATFTLKDDNGNYVSIDENNKVTLIPEANTVEKEEDAKNGKVLVPTLKTDSTGIINIIGLDAGEYTLTETEAPAGGYNVVDGDITLTIEANITDNGNVTDYAGVATSQLTNYLDTENDNKDLGGYVKLTATSENSDNNTKIFGEDGTESYSATGTVSLTVLNYSGSKLPSTGGIGTTVFYLSGGVLVVGAGVTLIAKKRMKNSK